MFFNQPVDLVLGNKQENFFGFDFVILASSQGLQVDQFKKLISLLLAQKSPTQVVRVLPDQSKINELVARPDLFDWQPIEVDDKIFYQISQSDLKFNLVYYQSNYNFYLSSSSQTLASLLSDHYLDIDKLLAACGLDSQSNFFIVNNTDMTLSYLPAELMVFGSNRFGKMLGCIPN